jgi:hypothetical protein
VHRAIPLALGVTLAVQVTALSTAGGQDARPNACTLIDAAEVTRLSGEKDALGKGPESVDADFKYPKHKSVCMYGDLIFELATNETPESFARNPRATDKRFKVQPISGLGDEAYYLWDASVGTGVRSVSIAFRSGSKRVAIEKLTTSDSIEAVKKMLLPVARTTVAKVK